MTELLQKLKTYIDTLEKWEADWIESDESWNTESGLPILTDDLYNRWCNQPGNLQAMRNEIKALLDQAGWQPMETRPTGATAWFMTPENMPQILRLGTWDNGVHKSTHWMLLPTPPTVV